MRCSGSISQRRARAPGVSSPLLLSVTTALVLRCCSVATARSSGLRTPWGCVCALTTLSDGVTQ